MCFHGFAFVLDKGRSRIYDNGLDVLGDRIGGHVVIDVESSLCGDRNVLPGLGDHVWLELAVDDILVVASLHQNVSVWIHHHRVAVRLVPTTSHVSGWRAHHDIHLVVDSPGNRKLGPELWSGHGVERSWIEHDSCALSGSHHGKFWEPDIVADSQTHFTEVFELEHCGFISWSQRYGLFESHLARNVDVEQVHLSVLRNDLSRLVESERSIVYFIIGAQFRE
ncbi:hypothetical protein OGAPHI_004205 [Ogataea philodendri]|uniref:Uncharacterized protein n=1 Tax=Ogataea philodendri TaxID=1378263 RepID=A0A9P8T4R9_9ASCO|nr:uncharacterized protein OGAPHI_004205 [Ogataea philodendri]KAH3666016.1 hypothetical protein OGAPHI_004205 [Ogataea philodendri]